MRSGVTSGSQAEELAVAWMAVLSLFVVAKVPTLTVGGHKQLPAELSQLKTYARKDMTDQIRKATESGGAVDKAEYDEVKNEQGFLESRIADLENNLANAVVAS